MVSPLAQTAVWAVAEGLAAAVVEWVEADLAAAAVAASVAAARISCVFPPPGPQRHR